MIQRRNTLIYNNLLVNKHSEYDRWFCWGLASIKNYYTYPKDLNYFPELPPPFYKK